VNPDIPIYSGDQALACLISSKDIAANPLDQPRPDGGCNRDEDVAHILPGQVAARNKHRSIRTSPQQAEGGNSGPEPVKNVAKSRGHDSNGPLGGSLTVYSPTFRYGTSAVNRFKAKAPL
jgi:hypothetical protein